MYMPYTSIWLTNYIKIKMNKQSACRQHRNISAIITTRSKNISCRWHSYRPFDGRLNKKRIYTGQLWEENMPYYRPPVINPNTLSIDNSLLQLHAKWVKFSIYDALIYVPFYGRVVSAQAADAVFGVCSPLLRKKLGLLRGSYGEVIYDLCKFTILYSMWLSIHESVLSQYLWQKNMYHENVCK